MAEIQKHKNFITIYSEFQAAAIEGSKNLIDGRIPPLNPMDDTKKHIYIYNNIFFSIAN
jgi:protein TIF31